MNIVKCMSCINGHFHSNSVSSFSVKTQQTDKDPYFYIYDI